MNLIMLYGAPAVGKLTVASAVADSSGYIVFDNHTVIDMIEPVVSRSHPKFRQLVYQTQLAILATAAESNERDIITTFPYAANEPDDVAFMGDLVEKCIAAGGNVYLIHLVASVADLLERVEADSRQRFGKITDRTALGTMIETYDFTTDAPSTFLTVDTSLASAHEAATIIRNAIEPTQNEK